MKNFLRYIGAFLLFSTSNHTNCIFAAAAAPEGRPQYWVDGITTIRPLPDDSPEERKQKEAELIQTIAKTRIPGNSQHVLKFLREGDITTAQNWLKTHPDLDLTAQDARGNTALFYAALLVIRIGTPASYALLDTILGYRGGTPADLDKRYGISGQTLLHQLVSRFIRLSPHAPLAYIEVCRKLFMAGASPKTALQLLDNLLARDSLLEEQRSALEAMRTMLSQRIRRALIRGIRDGRVQQLVGEAQELFGNASRTGVKGILKLRRTSPTATTTSDTPGASVEGTSAGTHPSVDAAATIE